jgi:hypothetical protein
MKTKKQLKQFEKLSKKINKKTGRRVLDEQIDNIENLKPETLWFIEKVTGSLLTEIESYDTTAPNARFKSKEEAVKVFLAQNFDINKKNIFNMSLLNYAAKRKDAEFAKFLVQNGANPNDKLPSESYPLHIFADDSDMIKFLLENGANLEAKDGRGFTPIYYSLDHRYWGGALSPFDTFVKHGANVNAISKDKTTPLHWALYKQDYYMVECLLKSGATKYINTECYNYTICNATDRRYPGDADTTPIGIAKSNMMDTRLLKEHGAIDKEYNR